MNRFSDPLLTRVESYRTGHNGELIVTVRDEGGYLHDRVAADTMIVAGEPNPSRLEKWNAAGRPEIKSFPLPSNNHGGSWRRTGIPRAS
jgi:hypothetical protein